MLLDNVRTMQMQHSGIAHDDKVPTTVSFNHSGNQSVYDNAVQNYPTMRSGNTPVEEMQVVLTFKNVTLLSADSVDVTFNAEDVVLSAPEVDNKSENKEESKKRKEESKKAKEETDSLRRQVDTLTKQVTNLEAEKKKAEEDLELANMQIEDLNAKQADQAAKDAANSSGSTQTPATPPVPAGGTQSAPDANQ